MKLSKNLIIALFLSVAVSGYFVSAGEVEHEVATESTSEELANENVEVPEAAEESTQRGEHVLPRSQRSSQLSQTKKRRLPTSLKLGGVITAILAALGAGYSLMSKASVETGESGEQAAAELVQKATDAFEAPATSVHDRAAKRDLKKIVAMLGGGAAAVTAAALAYYFMQQGVFENLFEEAPKVLDNMVYDNATIQPSDGHYKGQALSPKYSN